jgi:hypothetical protein
MEEGVRVVEEAREPGVLDGRQAAAGHGGAVDRQAAEAGAAQVGLEDEGVVPGAEEDGVVEVARS